MHKEGPTPGFIHLLVARRSPILSTSFMPEAPHELRVSRSEPPPGVDYIAGALDLEKLGQGLDLDEDNDLDDTDGAEEIPASSSSFKPKNPALDKLAAAANIRNMSYQRATHDSMMNATEDDSVFVGRDTRLPGSRPGLSSPTIFGRPSDTVLIQDDDYQVNMVQTSQFCIFDTAKFSSTKVSFPDFFFPPPQPPSASLVNWMFLAPIVINLA